MKARVWGSAIVLALAIVADGAAAQGTCQFNGWGSCTLGGDATHSISVTITATSVVQLAGGTVTLPTPDQMAYNAGFSGVGSVAYSIKANAAWTLGISGTSALWSATPPSARQDKPREDLQWATAPGGPFTDLSGATVSLSSGAATAGTVLTLYLRSKLAYATDNAGSYSIPVRLTITAP